MPKQSRQRKLLFGSEAANETGSPFEKARKEIVDQMRKELPIGQKIKIELTTHRHPLEGVLSLSEDPLTAVNKEDPSYKINKIEFRKRDILSWCVID